MKKEIIIIYGRDPQLLIIRRELLRQAGFDVDVILAPNFIVASLAGADCRLLVLCHSLSRQETIEKALAIRTHYPRLQILVLSAVLEHPELDGCSTFSIYKGPLALIRLCEALVGAQSHS